MGSICLKKGVKLATFETNLVHSAAEARKGYIPILNQHSRAKHTSRLNCCSKVPHFAISRSSK